MCVLAATAGNSSLATARPINSAGGMYRVSDERAVWLARNVLPIEPALRAWLRRRRLSESEIDDLVQETYAKLITLPSVENIRDPKNYAFQVAHSIFASRIRRARIVPIHAGIDLSELAIPANDGTPEDIVQAREELLELAGALASLPLRCRTAFLLRRVDGLSQREVAQRLGISEKTVENYMTQAIRFLMDRYGRGGKTHLRTSKTVRVEAAKQNAI
ncbi:MAG TPA: sigma-70 family RNA polymerase sigma factor, partial [Rhizomicrobium sp.]